MTSQTRGAASVTAREPVHQPAATKIHRTGPARTLGSRGASIHQRRKAVWQRHADGDPRQMLSGADHSQRRPERRPRHRQLVSSSCNSVLTASGRASFLTKNLTGEVEALLGAKLLACLGLIHSLVKGLIEIDALPQTTPEAALLDASAPVPACPLIVEALSGLGTVGIFAADRSWRSESPPGACLLPSSEPNKPTDQSRGQPLRHPASRLAARQRLGQLIESLVIHLTSPHPDRHVAKNDGAEILKTTSHNNLMHSIANIHHVNSIERYMCIASASNAMSK
jgi:hypothetical protein